MSDILKQIERLALSDTEHSKGNANDHRYRLGPRLSERDCSSIEREYGILLPNEYRDFITQIGNGGIGPGYGIERFLVTDSVEKLPTPPVSRVEYKVLERIRGPIRVPVARFDATGNKIDDWEFRYFELAKSYAPNGDLGRACLKLPFEIATPFRTVIDEWAAIDPPEWSSEIQEEYRSRSLQFASINPNNGTLRLCHYGCGIYAYLILNGPMRGDIWIYDPSYGDFVPAPMRNDLHLEMEIPKSICSPTELMRWMGQRTRLPAPAASWGFSEWYEHWLKNQN